MWQPPQRVKFKPAYGQIPTREESARSLLFQPIRLGPSEIAQRTWVPAMVPWRASDDGFVGPDVLDWYARFARGRPGVIVIEATGIRDIASGPLLRISDDRFIPGLRRLAETIHRASDGHTKAFIQLIDFLRIRRRPDPRKYFERHLKITDRHRELAGAIDWAEDRLRAHLACLPSEEQRRMLSEREWEALQYGARERVTDTEVEHIRDLPRILPAAFSSAAIRAQRAGIDGIELHYAHAYTMAAFLSRTNCRNDGYGGSRDNRIRVPLEVYRAVRRAVGDNYVVGCRFLADECIAGGSTLDETVFFGVEFAKAGMDFLSTSRGGKFDDAKQPSVGAAAYPYTGRSGYECMPQYLSDEAGPFGRNIPATAAIRGAVRAAGMETPVVCTGGVHNFEMAERMLKQGDCDIVGSARQSLADPDWLRKVAIGHGHAVRLCEYTNYCEGLDQKHKQVTCQLWDKLALDEAGVKLASDGKRRLVAPEWNPVMQ